METENKRGFVLSIAAALSLIIGGIVLTGVMLNRIPADGSMTPGDFLLGAAASLAPTFAGGFWMGTLFRRRRINPKTGNGITFGVLLILAGLFMLCFSTGIFPAAWRMVFISWQMLLIVVGLAELFKQRYISGLIFFTAGSFLIVPRIARLYPGTWQFGEAFTSTYWPVLLVVFGILVIFGVIAHPGKCRGGGHSAACAKERMKRRREATGHNVEEVYGREGYVDYDLNFTGAEQVFLDPVFRGGRIKVFFAGITLDLRRAELQEGTSYLEIDAVFGGVVIIAPPEWKIESRNKSTMGGFSDKRAPHFVRREDDGRKLVIAGNYVFGGGELK